MLFSHDNERIVGTEKTLAHLYSARTGQRTMTLSDPNSNKYNFNCACFNMTDDLVLSDGILWDPRVPRRIHKFDKFTNYAGGDFHPNGLELIINSENWDLRTFKLLRTIPALDQTQLAFSPGGDVIYGVVRQFDDDDDPRRSHNPFGSSFRTYDATDYSSIATIDLERKIFDLAVDPNDRLLAVVENGSAQHPNVTVPMESACRVYEIGRRRPTDSDSDLDDTDIDESEDEDETDEDDEDDDDDDDSMDQDLEDEEEEQALWDELGLPYSDEDDDLVVWSDDEL